MPERPEVTTCAEAIIEAITQPFLILGRNLTVESANSAFYRCFESTAKDTLGRPVDEIGKGQWNIPGLRRLLEEVLSANGKVEDHQVELKFEHIGERVMLLSAARIRRRIAEDPILLVISDEAERERFIWEFGGQQKVMNLGMQSADKSFYERFKLFPKGREGRLIYYELGNGQWDIPQLRRFLEELVPIETSFENYMVEREFEHIGRRFIVLNRRRLDRQDHILFGIRDVTEQRKAERVEEVVREELQHRVNNILANVRALAMHIRRRYNTVEEFFEAFEARLLSLARPQDYLLKGTSEAVGLHEVVQAELDAVGAEEGRDFIVHGPDVWLSPHQARVLSMTIHELTTNSAKHGALSAPAGRIDIVWRTEWQENRACLNLHWREQGVTINNTTPSKGFGTQIIETSVPQMLGGTAKLVFHPDGVAYSMVFPLTLDQESKP